MRFRGTPTPRSPTTPNTQPTLKTPTPTNQLTPPQNSRGWKSADSSHHPKTTKSPPPRLAAPEAPALRGEGSARHKHHPNPPNHPHHQHPNNRPTPNSPQKTRAAKHRLRFRGTPTPRSPTTPNTQPTLKTPITKNSHTQLKTIPQNPPIKIYNKIPKNATQHHKNHQNNKK